MLRGQISMYLPPEHPIIDIWDNGIQNGRRIGKKVFWTFRIIWNDFKIRFPHVTLSRNFRTAFTHSLVVSSNNTQNSLVVNFGVETTYRQNCQGVLWGYIAGNLKHIVQYVGAADADLWRGGTFFYKVFCHTQCKHSKVSSESWKLNKNASWGRMSLLK